MMDINLTVNLAQWTEIKALLQGMSDKLDLLLQQEGTLMAAIDDLAAAVAAEDTTIDSAVALINGFAAQLAAAGTDPAKLSALQTDIVNKTAQLAAAVVQNTPAPPPTPTSGTPPPAVTPAAAAALAQKAVADMRRP
jgi:hypothetical protein